MSEDDGFLGRWSRRKRSAARKRERPAPPSVATEASVPNTPAAAIASETVAELPALPPIESLDAASDIAPFLAPGVPAELTRQALRRAWAADPAIRDFVGLSENAWDFNAPDGVPGFGSLTSGEIRRLLDGVIGKPDSPGPPPEAPGPATAELPPAPADNAMLAQTAAAAPVTSAQPERDQETPRAVATGRRHGGALPQ